MQPRIYVGYNFACSKKNGSPAFAQLGRGSQGPGYRCGRGTLSQLFDDFCNDFNGAVDFRFGVEPAKGKAQTPSGVIGSWIHCSQHM
jgi:hypothetical protein